MCTHHWILDSDSYGKCKLCGEEKQFATYSAVANGQYLEKGNRRYSSETLDHKFFPNHAGAKTTTLSL